MKHSYGTSYSNRLCDWEEPGKAFSLLCVGCEECIDTS